MCDAYEPPRVGEDGKDDVPLKAIPTNSRASCAEVSTCIMLRLASIASGGVAYAGTLEQNFSRGRLVANPLLCNDAPRLLPRNGA